MNAEKVLEYIGQQEEAIQGLRKQLEEIQVEFNGQFDRFKARHDAALERVTELVAARYASDRGAVPATLLKTIEERLPEEQQKIEERRTAIRERFLPDRQKAADEVLAQAQAELAELRALNPQLDAREEGLKKQKGELEGQLGGLNDQIRSRSRGLGVALHFRSILKADQERQRLVGKLEAVNGSLLEVRRDWEEKQKAATAHQAELQNKWQLECIAVARLQAELEQLDEAGSLPSVGGLALRRAAYRALDAMNEAPPQSPPYPPLRPEASEGTGGRPETEAGPDALEEVAELNRQTDAYQAGLASVAGLMGLLKGIGDGMGAIRESIKGLKNEQEMHSSYLRPLSFEVPPAVRAFHEQWPELDRRFADEKEIAQHPAEFSAAVRPVAEEALAQARIEGMFDELGRMIKEATAGWA